MASTSGSVALYVIKTGVVYKNLKTPLLGVFEVKRDQLKSFLTYTELFIRFNSIKLIYKQNKYYRP